MRFLAICCLFVTVAHAEVDANAKDVKNIQFESLLIQGQLQRPDISIITGDGGEDMDGLLRLRNDFTDLMAAGQGEALP